MESQITWKKLELNLPITVQVQWLSTRCADCSLSQSTLDPLSCPCSATKSAPDFKLPLTKKTVALKVLNFPINCPKRQPAQTDCCTSRLSPCFSHSFVCLRINVLSFVMSCSFSSNHMAQGLRWGGDRSRLT